MLCQGFKRAQQELPMLRLEFDQLSLTIPASGKNPPLTILKGVNGSIEPAKVTAIMGPSGAGKTSLLHTLLGRIDPSWECGGSLLVNGASELLRRFKKIIGFVPQDDLVHPDLSVYDNVKYAANTRLPANWTTKQREDHVNATIAAMQLRHVQDTLVGNEVRRGISGGQRSEPHTHRNKHDLERSLTRASFHLVHNSCSALALPCS
jgi:ABC-type multidrug transport system ATPase subunit